jgi:hypothetical protein
MNLSHSGPRIRAAVIALVALVACVGCLILYVIPHYFLGSQ